MAKPTTAAWAPRVRRGRIRRLYGLDAKGIHDEDLLAEVGWSLHARCADALVVTRAMRGEVPCPECGKVVARTSRRGRTDGPPRSNARPFACPECGGETTWQECRDALRSHPRCLDCGRPLRWQYAEGRLTCRPCGREWAWDSYRRSVSGRVRLPCARCHRRIRRPEPPEQPAKSPAPARAEHVACPKCGAQAIHARARLTCAACGYDVEWRKYRRRMKRRAERLTCGACGHAFTWQSWRKRYRGHDLLTGMPAPLRRFVSVWPECRTPQAQMLEIDRLIHAAHARGPLGPVLIEGSAEAVAAFLDELAGTR